MKIKLEVCARIAEIVGAIAVVVSVIYLAVQIKDNTRLLRSQAHFNALSLGQRPIEFLIDNDTLAAILVQCNTDLDHTPPVALERCLNYYFLELNAWEYMYYQNLDGSIPHEFWVGADAFFKSLMVTKPGYRRTWQDFHFGFDEPFHSYANGEYLKATDPAR